MISLTEADNVKFTCSQQDLPLRLTASALHSVEINHPGANCQFAAFT